MTARDGYVLHLTRWLWPAACLVTLLGYFGPWIAHPVAGLSILGLDLAEYVKFLPNVMSGEIALWREGFYAPLFVVGLACSLLTYRREYGYPFAPRLALILLGVVATLNMLPPAWSPAVLRTPEFRLQTVAILFNLALLMASPILALLPALPVYAVSAALTMVAIALPVQGFLRVLPSIAALYRDPLRPSWALYCMVLGLTLLIVACWTGYERAKAA